jgi:hypothetical protein
MSAVKIMRISISCLLKMSTTAMRGNAAHVAKSEISLLVTVNICLNYLKSIMKYTISNLNVFIVLQN